MGEVGEELEDAGLDYVALAAYFVAAALLADLSLEH